MSIKIELRDPWTLHPEKLNLPLDADDCLTYEIAVPTIDGQTLLDAIGLARKEICFVRINKSDKKLLSRDFVKESICDGDFVALYPFSIAG